MLFIISIINGQTKITTPFFELNCKCKLIINESEDYSYNYVYESYLNGSVNIYYSITIYNYYTPTSNRDEIFN